MTAGPARSPQERGYLFIASHMRSYSSLLAHLFGSHPEIDGYSELHRSYETGGDLRGMTAAIEASTGERRRGRYALDKVLHDSSVLAPAILARDDVRVLILLRRPDETIPSIARLARDPGGAPLAEEPRLAAEYYVRRLGTLDAISAVQGPRAAFVASETLIAEPDAVLARLTRWLGLATPLAGTYRTFPQTGVDGLGDPSAAIRTGRVLRADEAVDEPKDPVDVPAAAMQAAIDAYEALLPRLRARHPA